MPIYELLKKIYFNSPIQFQTYLSEIIFKKRRKNYIFSKVYNETYKQLEQSQWWSRAKHEDHRFMEMKKLLEHAYNTTKYYRKLFDEYDIVPNKVKEPEDILKIPYLTKEIVSENIQDMISSKFSNGQIQYASTGGSTGIPLGFYIEKDVTMAKESAFIDIQWARVGYDHKSRPRQLRIRRNLNSYREKYNSLWYYRQSENHLVFSGHRLERQSLSKLFSLLKKYKPEFIVTVPSICVELADYFSTINSDIKLSLKAILLSSENIYDQQRDYIENVFSSKVFGLYGNTERTVMAANCEHSYYYHVVPEYAFTELIDIKGNWIQNDGELGEIISTGFNNYVMPFIRYRTGDMATHSNDNCKCGRNYPLWKRIEGRLQELAVTKNNSKISIAPALLCNIPNEDYIKIKEFQVVQKEPGKLIVNIVRREQFSEAETSKVMYNLINERFEGLFDVEIAFVDFIPRTQQNKFRFFIQEINLNHPMIHVQFRKGKNNEK